MAALPFVLLLLALPPATALSLEIRYYRYSCPRAEIIVKRVVEKHFQQDPSVPAGLLRLHFHDCFVRGCDASVLVDSTPGNVAEKESPPNLTLRTFDVIDDIKAELEKECSGVVSCADILALATRDAVALSGGAAYALPTGRRDGTISRAADVQLPSPSSSVETAEADFRSINLDLVDLTTLLGAHGVGFCHCSLVTTRLYNYQGTGLSDPIMDPAMLSSLKQKCPPEVVLPSNITRDTRIFLNQATSKPFFLDTSFYQGLFSEKAVLELDQGLAFTDVTSKLAARYVRRPKRFVHQFSKSMIKLGYVGVLTGEEGEIRLDCRKVNNGTQTTLS
ncbi:peroxidase 57-like [Zingiber officinale]|uniref:peroxidase 57-like n=1 Tax=Zingiber officinale TaxID=94328 RepID=UPI001C4D189D|nr:peroxidase 57-like [Zingiber officinale]